MVRGFLTRRAVKKVFGFEANPSVLRRHTVHIEMDPEKLEEQRARVMEIRDRLPPFQYGTSPGDEEYEPGIVKEQRPMMTLNDGARYEGEWNVATENKHGKGY